jgi:protein SCO1
MIIPKNKISMRFQLSCKHIVVLILLLTTSLFAQRVRDDVEDLKRINVTEKTGDFIPLDIELEDQNGKKTFLNEIVNNTTPVIFCFAYYDCPMLCTQVLNSVSNSINKLDWESKDKFSVVTVSINPNDTAESARLKKERYVAGLDDRSLMYNWNFYTADQPTIDTLTKAFGFEYFYDKERDEYAHPAVVFVLSPEGKISRYLYGLNYEPKDLKLSLLEAANGKIGNSLDRLLLYCYHYDSTSNSYTLFATNIMRLGGILTIIIIGLFLGLYWFRENKKRIQYSN